MFSTMAESLMALQKWDARTFFRPTFFWLGGSFIWLFSHKWNWKIWLDYLLMIKGSLIPLLGDEIDTYWPIILAISFLSLLAITRIILWRAFPMLMISIIYVFNKTKLLIYSLNKKFDIYHRIDKRTTQLRKNYRFIDYIANSFFIKLITYPFQLSPTHCFGGLDIYLRERYGLNSSVLPYFLELLPEKKQEEINSIQESVFDRLDLIGWWVAFSFWAIWLKWLPIISIFMILKIIYFEMRPIQCAYAYQLKIAFDLYRFNLYEQLNYPLPEQGKDERKSGIALSEYLSKGFPLDRAGLLEYIKDTQKKLDELGKE
jgi:hypothetical protein